MTPLRERALQRIEGVQWHVAGDPWDRALQLAEECERRSLQSRRWKLLARSYRTILKAYRDR